MIAPESAPHMPRVLAMPLQKPVAMRGMSGDSMPWLRAMASSTLSAQ